MANTSQTNRQVDERAAHRRIWVNVLGAAMIGIGFGFVLIVALMVHGGTR